MKDIAYSNTQFKRFAKYFNGFVEKKLKYYIGFATETSEDVWWYDGSKVMFRSELSSKFLHAMQENQDITIEELVSVSAFIPCIIQKKQ